MIQLVLGSLHHFYENIQEHFQEHRDFMEILKQVFRVHFPGIMF